ncbi:hypothetical protein EX30DRAFT_362367 [Ascodesmis nigricans]|uniref:Gag1-like clamp domain-containing protein n=1 Tax=Ascodesmis nigricans TaxID=341454 RepID=A0A4S2N1D0_9PEZI|nr:hypothetical protein EX30DRAFT_362367 [Ascodesmis nigricans]
MSFSNNRGPNPQQPSSASYYNELSFPPTNRRPPTPGHLPAVAPPPGSSGSMHYPPRPAPTIATSLPANTPIISRQEKADAIREIKTLLSQVRNDWEYTPPLSSEERRRRRQEREARRAQREQKKEERVKGKELERKKSVKMQAGILRTSSLRSGGLGEWRSSAPGALPDSLHDEDDEGDDKEKSKQESEKLDSDEDSDSEYEELEKKRRRERGEYVWEDAWATESSSSSSDTESEGGDLQRTTFFSDDSTDHDDDDEDSDSDSSSLDATPPLNTTTFRRRSSTSSHPTPSSIPQPKSRPKRRPKRRPSFSHRLHTPHLPRLPDSPPTSPTHDTPASLSPTHTLHHQSRHNPNLRLFLRRRDQWTHADREGWVPVARSKFADNPMRKLVRPEAYKEIFDRCVVKGSELPVPIPLATMLVILKEGWVREGEWPPRVTPTPPPVGARGSEWGGRSIGAGGGMGLGRVKRYFGMR